MKIRTLLPIIFSTLTALIFVGCDKKQEEEPTRSRESTILDATKNAADKANKHTKEVDEALKENAE